MVVIDSIQTVYSEQLTSAPGSVAQVRECAAQLTRIAKSSNITMILVGHVTKEGALAGPRVLEHIVDTVLYFEGDTHSSFRLIRAFKNRFGAVNELGVFAMTEKGLREVSNPSALFLSQHGAAGRRFVRDGHAGRHAAVAGRDTGAGRRGACAEPAAAVAGPGTEPARDAARGAAPPCRHRLLRPGCVRQCGGRGEDHRAGGRPRGDARDGLQLRNKPLPEKLVVFGEVGLAGEVRPVQRGQERLREAAKLGFTQAIIPKANAPKQKIAGMEIIAVERVEEAVNRMR